MSMRKIIFLSIDLLIFLIVVPLLIIQLGKYLEQYFSRQWNPLLGRLVILISLPAGLIILFWAIFVQWTIGRGTTSPLLPSKKLIVSGPYKLCRNPIELGTILYYLGLGTYFASFNTGLLGFLIMLVMGGMYFKLVEEKVLERRFGEEYLEYKKKTSFLLPKWWK